MEKFNNDDVLFRDDGEDARQFAKESLLLTLILFNIGIVVLMSSNIEFSTKFSKLSYIMVILILLCNILGFFVDRYEFKFGILLSFRSVKLLFLIFNFGICYQLNKSLNHGLKYIKITFILSIIGGILLYITEGNLRGSYLSNTIISLHTVKLLYEIKTKAKLKGMISMQLISMLRLEWLLLILNCIVCIVNFSGIYDYESRVMFSICIYYC